MNNKDLISKFYTSFAAANVEGMVECYHSDIVFTDPAFGTIKGDDAKNMWRMLISRGDGQTKIEFENVEANEKTGSANWRAEYNYGPNKRKVINIIKAQFEFQDGKIIRHIDDFDMWKWSKQALGASGYLLGWSSFMQNQIQKKTGGMLKNFSEKRNA